MAEQNGLVSRWRELRRHPAAQAGAAAAYSQFIRLWENADPELQPRVETARRALERLAAEKVN